MLGTYLTHQIEQHRRIAFNLRAEAVACDWTASNLRKQANAAELKANFLATEAMEPKP